MKTFFSLTIAFAAIFIWPLHIINADELSELKDQVLQMQEENNALQKQLNRQSEVMELLLNKVNALEVKEETVTRDVETFKAKEETVAEYVEELKAKETREVALNDNFDALNEKPFGPKLDMKGFADISFTADDNVSDDEQNYNTFSLGQLDLFLTSELSERINVLSEIVFEHEEDNDLEIEVERLEIKYALSEFFNIKFGRMHTALGFWNTEYHHSSWLHPTSFRPIIHEWEDESGIIPNHFVGLYIFGKTHFNRFDFEYDLGVANGRSKRADKIQNMQDGNDSKAFNARFQFAPESLPGLKFGASAYADKIPADGSTEGRAGEIDELILGGHIVYFKENLELMAEYMHLNHNDEVSHDDFDTFGFYLQGAYQFNKLKPYYRFELVDFAVDDPFYTEENHDIIRHTLGMRWDPIIWNSIKLEYGFSGRNEVEDIHSLTIQSAFSF